MKKKKKKKIRKSATKQINGSQTVPQDAQWKGTCKKKEMTSIEVKLSTNTNYNNKKKKNFSADIHSKLWEEDEELASISIDHDFISRVKSYLFIHFEFLLEKNII